MTVRADQATSVDLWNSTSEPLAAAEVFTGRTVDMTKFASVTVMVSSDAPSGDEGMSLEQSTDGVNWDRKRQFTLEAGETYTFGLDLVSQYFRVVYTNGIYAQTEFRMQSVFHLSRQETLFNDDPERYIPVRLTDGTGFKNGHTAENQRSDMIGLLECILSELQLTNYYNSLITDEEATKDDI